MSLSHFSFPTSIRFGAQARFETAKLLKSKELKRPLVVTDQGLSQLPIFKEWYQWLLGENIQATLFNGVQGNPTESQVLSGKDAYLAGNCDSLIGFGGGAALDVAKAILVVIHHQGSIFDYEDENPKSLPIDQPIPYWIAIASTAGTGSEAGRACVISEDDSHLKRIIFSPRLLAPEVLGDPEITLDLPAWITAATGMDALTHCVEAYLTPHFHPLCNGIALEGIKLISESLVKCYETPHDLEARSKMLMSSMMGGIAFQKGLGIVHSCAHALGIHADLHHGYANAVMIDHALNFNLSTCPEKFIRMAATVGTQSESPEQFLSWLRELKSKLQIPKRLSDIAKSTARVPGKFENLTQEHLPKLSQLATKDPCHLNNPRKCTEKDFQAVFENAL